MNQKKLLSVALGQEPAELVLKNAEYLNVFTAEFLRGALEDAKLVEGEESDYGLFVKTVDGVTADDANEEWWCFTKGGEPVMTSVDSTPIADGDTFEITLTTGY